MCVFEFVFDNLYWKVELTCRQAGIPPVVTDEWANFKSFIKVTLKGQLKPIAYFNAKEGNILTQTIQRIL